MLHMSTFTQIIQFTIFTYSSKGIPNIADFYTLYIIVW